MIRRSISKSVSIMVMVSLLVQMTFFGSSGEALAAPKKAQLKKRKVTIDVGKTYAVALKNKQKKATYSFKSSDKKVATVSKTGKVKGVKKGSAKITVRQKLKKKTQKVGVLKVTVRSAVSSVPPTSVPPTQAPATLTPVTQAPATLTPASQIPTEPTSSTEPTPSPTVEPSYTPFPKEDFVYEGLDMDWIGENIDPNKPVVAFTFDDGPVGSSESSTGIQIQNILEENNAHATFFYWGSRIDSQDKEDEIKRAHSMGFEIGNHTWTHRSLGTASVTPGDVLREVGDTNAKLTELTGLSNFLFRPPNISTGKVMMDYIHAPIITLTQGRDTSDYNANTTADEIYFTLRTCQDGDIVLMHEGYPKTVEALTRAFDYFKQNDTGMQVVSVSELFAIKQRTLKTGVAYSGVK